MTTIQKEIPLADINVGERFRKDYGNIAELAETIRDKGLLQPLTVDQDLNLLTGGRRYQALALLETELVPVLIRNTSSDVDAREVELIENVFRKDLTWQERAQLEAEIYALKGSQRATAEAIGGSAGAVNRHVQLAKAIAAVPALAECKTEDEAWKAMRKIEETIIVKELVKRQEAKQKDSADPNWDHAVNHYLIGDAIAGMQSLHPGVWNFAEVDPPYGIALDEVKKKDGLGAQGLKGHDNYTEVAGDEYRHFLFNTAYEVYRLLTHNSFCVWWFGCTHYELVRTTLIEIGFEVADIPGIWYKGNQGQTNQPNVLLANCYETFFVARKGKPMLHTPGRSNVFHFPPVPGAKKTHPTERPVELIMEIIRTFMWPSMKLISPFLGSGATLRSAYQLGTYGIGWDLSEEHKAHFLLKIQQDSEEGLINVEGDTSANADGPGSDQLPSEDAGLS